MFLHAQNILIPTTSADTKHSGDTAAVVKYSNAHQKYVLSSIHPILPVISLYSLAFYKEFC